MEFPSHVTGDRIALKRFMESSINAILHNVRVSFDDSTTHFKLIICVFFLFFLKTWIIVNLVMHKLREKVELNAINFQIRYVRVIMLLTLQLSTWGAINLGPN